MSDQTGTGLEVESPLGKFKAMGKDANTVVTILSFVVTCVIAYTLITHQQDTREMSKDFAVAIREQTVALKDQTTAAREQNCLLRFAPDERQSKAEFCRTVTR